MNQSLWLVPLEYNRCGKSIEEKYALSPIISRLLAKRGVETLGDADLYFSSSWDALYDPALLMGMDRSVSRIEDAIRKHEQIVIYGDYDVDGITSTALLMKAFRHLDADVHFYLPDRMEEGYGLNSDAITQLARSGAKLIITVDCGISAVNPALEAKACHVDLIITDHHECQEILPEAYAIINPKQKSCQYPEKMLAGAGIALKLAQGLLGDKWPEIREDLVALAALGTVADLAPLKGENRLITKLGLQSINQKMSIGLRMLIEKAGIKAESITAGHIGFQIGPRLNATGRLEKANVAVELLLSSDETFCRETANELNQLNQIRQGIESEIVEKSIHQVEQLVEQEGLPTIIILKDTEFHVGVVGIAASRLVERYHRPVILLNEEDGILKGSARSVGDFNIFEAISSASEYLVHFGGHKQAAGLKLDVSEYTHFCNKMLSYTRLTILPTDLIPRVSIEDYLSAQDVTIELADALEKLEPFGMGNPKPIFAMKQLMVEGVQWLGKEKNHVKLVLNKAYRMFEAIQFRTLFSRESFQLNEALDLAFYIEKNHFRAVETLQLHIKSIRFKNALQQENNPLLIAYVLGFLDALSREHHSPMSKKDFNGLIVADVPIHSMGEILGPNRADCVAVFTLQGAVDLFYEGNGDATDWNQLIGGDQKKIFLCPLIDQLMDFAKGNQQVLDIPFNRALLTALSELGYPLRIDPYWVKKQADFLEDLVIERTELAEYYKKALLKFSYGVFSYNDWLSFVSPKCNRGLFALRLLLDGDIVVPEEKGFRFKEKPEKISVYELELMRNVKIYRENLKVAIEYCQTNKLL